MSILLKWAWPILAFGLAFDAFSTQIFHDVPSLEGAGAIVRIAFAFGGLLGDLPIIAVIGIVITAVFKARLSSKLSPRVIGASIGLASVCNAVIVLPIFRALMG